MKPTLPPAEHRPDQAPAERWQHGQTRETNSDGRENVAKPIASLLRSKLADDADVAASERFYRAYVFGMFGASVDPHEGPSGSPSPDAAMVARMDAMADYSLAAKALDKDVLVLLRALIIEEVSIFALAGRRAGRPFCRVQTEASEALKALTEFYARKDRSRGGYKNG